MKLRKYASFSLVARALEVDVVQFVQFLKKEHYITKEGTLEWAGLNSNFFIKKTRLLKFGRVVNEVEEVLISEAGLIFFV